MRVGSGSPSPRCLVLSFTSLQRESTSIKPEPLHPEEVDGQFEFRWLLHPWREYTLLIRHLQHSFWNCEISPDLTTRSREYGLLVYWFIGCILFSALKSEIARKPNIHGGSVIADSLNQ